jgi:hypothetical protein
LSFSLHSNLYPIPYILMVAIFDIHLEPCGIVLLCLG